jgi:signal transduction histidine kinase
VLEAVEAADPLMKAEHHTLQVITAPGPVPVHADRNRVVQVFTNLLSNAAKFTEPGGSISIAVAHENGQAVVRTRDNGIGLEPHQTGRIFEMFSQAGHSTGRMQSGLGIGLKLVKELVEMHGGSVEVHSEGAGKGSEFTVRLPLVLE